MKIFTKWLFLAIVVLLGFAVSQTEAGRRGHRNRRHFRHPYAINSFYGFPSGFYRGYDYSKYYGGFHARYFQDIGIPPGDIGIRGNGIYATPW